MADLTFTTTIAVTVGNIDYAYTSTSTYSSITEPVQTSISVGTGVQDILTIGAAGPGAIPTAIKLLQIKNTDSTNFVIIGLKDTGGDTAYHKVGPGSDLVVSSDQLDVNITGAVFAAFSTVDTITAEADTAACIIELNAFG